MEDDDGYLITEEEMFENLKVSNVALIRNYTHYGKYQKLLQEGEPKTY